MRIIGFNLKKISGRRKENIKGKLEIKSNIKIDDIQKDKLDISEKDAFKFDFTFTIDYNPDFANVELQGSIIALVEKNQVKKILKDWKNKKTSEEIQLPLFNFILSKCSLKAMSIEEDLSLPSHVPMPRITAQQPSQSANYAG